MKLFKEPVSPKEQRFLLPPSVDEFVAPDAPVRILGDVMDQLDCSVLYKRYRGGGAPAFEPRRMLKTLVFGYSQGIRSSRKLAQALEHDLRFMYLAEMSKPDFHTICRFRRDHEEAIRALFGETVILAQRLGMALLEHAAVDGTKIEANVARRRVVDAGQIQKRLAAVEEQIKTILEEAEAQDAAEDAEHGSKRGDEVPKELADKRERKARLERAKELLAQEGAKTVATTDPKSRLMKTQAGLRAAYNAQAVVDKENQIIIAAEVTQDEGDTSQLAPMLEQAREQCGRLPEQVSADAGYWSVGALEYVNQNGIDGYIAAVPRTKRQKDALLGWTYVADEDLYRSDTGEEMHFNRVRERDGRQYRVYRKRAGGLKEVWIRQNDALGVVMRQKLSTPHGRSTYLLRQQVVEPVFGHIKSVLGFRRLLLRGVQGARIEYLLACTAHNLKKVVRHQIAQAA